MIVLAAVVPAIGLMLLLGMARLEAHLLRPERTGGAPSGGRQLPSRPVVIQRLALPTAGAGERILGDPAWTEAAGTLPARSP